jgi:hypothetical protein
MPEHKIHMRSPLTTDNVHALCGVQTTERYLTPQDKPWRKPTCYRCLALAEKKNHVFPPVPMVKRVNIISGLEFEEPEDTPYFLSPSSETYWSS